jgi:CMD domain protein
MSTTVEDLAGLAAGIVPGSPLDKLRAARRETGLNAEKSRRLLFDRGDEDVSRRERLGLAFFTAAIQGGEELARAYRGELAGEADRSLISALEEELLLITASGVSGPYGIFPAGPLSAGNKPGPVYSISPKNRSAFGPRLGAALEHAHFLTFHPRDGKAENIQRLLDSGWSRRGIVIVSQIIAFLAYQVRLVRGLAVLRSSLKEG